MIIVFLGYIYYYLFLLLFKLLDFELYMLYYRFFLDFFCTFFSINWLFLYQGYFLLFSVLFFIFSLFYSLLFIFQQLLKQDGVKIAIQIIIYLNTYCAIVYWKLAFTISTHSHIIKYLVFNAIIEDLHHKLKKTGLNWLNDNQSLLFLMYNPELFFFCWHLLYFFPFYFVLFLQSSIE